MDQSEPAHPTRQARQALKNLCALYGWEMEITQRYYVQLTRPDTPNILGRLDWPIDKWIGVIKVRDGLESVEPM
ncbi:MAG: hypothetical protein ACHQ9S_18710 [Candidatus Binatia bacterium]